MTYDTSTYLITNTKTNMNQRNQQRNQRNQLNIEWATLLITILPEADNYVEHQIKAIIEAKTNGFYPKTLMSNMINKYKNGRRSDEIIPTLTADEIDQEFEALLRTIDPRYGDPIANEIAEILEMKLMSINVDALQLNVISKRNNETPSQPAIIDISDTDE